MPTNPLAERNRAWYNEGVGRPGSVNCRAALSNSAIEERRVPERYSTAPRFPVNDTSSAHACAGGA